MTIKSSGPISISHINTELGLASATTKNLGNSEVRSLLQRTSGAVPLSSAYGKSKVVPGGRLNQGQWNTGDYIEYGASPSSSGSLSPSPMPVGGSTNANARYIYYSDNFGEYFCITDIYAGSSLTITFRGSGGAFLNTVSLSYQGTNAYGHVYKSGIIPNSISWDLAGYFNVTFG